MKNSVFIVFLLLNGLATAYAQAPADAPAAVSPQSPCSIPGNDCRYVIIHKPGKTWNPNLDEFHQPYIMNNPNGQMEQTHIMYWGGLATAGKVMMGGPFPQSSGAVGSAVGMMIPAPGVSMQEMSNYAAADPAVKAGVLDFEVRQWLVGITP